MTNIAENAFEGKGHRRINIIIPRVNIIKLGTYFQIV
jgi:hypothetical protein